MDLQHGELHLKLSIVILQALNPEKDLTDGLLSDAFIVFSHVLRTMQGVGLTRPSLSVRKYTYVVPIKGTLDQRFDFLKHLCLTGLWAQHAVEFVTHGSRAIIDGDLDRAVVETVVCVR